MGTDARPDGTVREHADGPRRRLTRGRRRADEHSPHLHPRSPLHHLPYQRQGPLHHCPLTLPSTPSPASSSTPAAPACTTSMKAADRPSSCSTATRRGRSTTATLSGGCVTGTAASCRTTSAAASPTSRPHPATRTRWNGGSKTSPPCST